MQWPEQEKNAQEIERGDRGETLFDSHIRMKHFRANFATPSNPQVGGPNC